MYYMVIFLPVSAVFTAVSTNPIVWKKNSVGLRPLKNEFATTPFPAGVLSPLGKWGKDRSLKPLGVRYPLTIYYPTHATIYAILIGDPLEPALVIINGVL